MKLLRNSLIALFVALTALPATAADGMIAVKSAMPVAATMDKLESIVKAKGMKVFARIDHAAGAKSVGAEMRPTQLLVFGNPKGGTPFMACAQSVAIDLPLKALVWQDASGQVWLGYNDAKWIHQRHQAGDCPVSGKIANALAAFAAAATKP